MPPSLPRASVGRSKRLYYREERHLSKEEGCTCCSSSSTMSLGAIVLCRPFESASAPLTWHVVVHSKQTTRKGIIQDCGGCVEMKRLYWLGVYICFKQLRGLEMSEFTDATGYVPEEGRTFCHLRPPCVWARELSPSLPPRVLLTIPPLFC